MRHLHDWFLQWLNHVLDLTFSSLFCSDILNDQLKKLIPFHLVSSYSRGKIFLEVPKQTSLQNS